MDSKRQLVTVDSLAGDADLEDDEEVVDVGWTPQEPEAMEVREAQGAEPSPGKVDEGALTEEVALDDERYGLDGVEPRPTAQKVVIAIVAVLVVLVALYVLDYWNVVKTGFSGLFGA